MKFLVCGEALIDLIHHSDNSWYAHSGGGALNTAKALAKMGGEVEFLCRVSTDPFGKQLAQEIYDYGISQNLMVATDDPTSLAVVEISAHGTPSYSFYLEKTSNFNWTSREIPNTFPLVDAIHIGTLALILEPGRTVLLNLMEKLSNSALIMVDLNARPTVVSSAEEYLQLLTPWLSIADVVKVSDDDLDFLFPGNLAQERINQLLEYPKINLIAVTHGSLGATLITRTFTKNHNAPEVEVKDTVGAGDTFGAGLLAKLVEFRITNSTLKSISKNQLEAALKFANAAAALSCTQSGSQPPTLSQIIDLNE